MGRAASRSSSGAVHIGNLESLKVEPLAAEGHRIFGGFVAFRLTREISKTLQVVCPNSVAWPLIRALG